MTGVISESEAQFSAAQRRVAALEAYGILDGEPDAGLDALSALAAQICDVPIAAVTLLDAEHQWLKAISGFDAESTRIEDSFCLHALDTPDRMLVVPDATTDVRFADNPLVVGVPGIRSYAGAPLVTPDGVPLGTMCAIDQRPRRLTSSQLEALTALADLAMQLLDARRNARMVAETENSFRAVFDNAAIGMLHVGLDGLIIQANPAFAGMIGYDVERLAGRSFSEITEGGEGATELDFMSLLINGQSRSVVWDQRYHHRNGHPVTAVSSTTAVRDADGNVTSVLSQVESIEERRLAEQSLMEIQSAVDAIITADGEGVITAWNDGAERVFGHTRSQALGQPVTIIMPERFRAAHSAGLVRVSEGGTSRLSGQTLELDAIRRDGSEFPIELAFSLWDFEGRPRFTAVIRDVTERRTLTDELVRQANTDALTGVGNRSWFTREVAAALQEPAPLSVLVLELQGLREVGNSLGMLLSDRIIVRVAARLTATLRPDDRLARIDNGDFAVLLPGTTPARARQVADRIRDVVPANFRVGSTPVSISACVGLADHRGAASAARAPVTAARLLRNATLALASARATPARLTAYSPAMSTLAQRRLKLHGSLQGAADRGELTLVYQPLLDLADNSLHGVEALARWSHPELGAISPTEFVPLAEDTGLATRLGAWVLRDACREAVAWSHLRAEPLPVSINVSGHQLMDPAICDTIRDVLTSAGLDPALLTLEITESVLMSEPDAVRERLTAIRSLGCRISIDDFGTGYSSLASLARFPIDELKIDQTFVAALPHDTATERVARAIIDLAEGLNLRTVAEGIETHQQLHMLTAMGCTTGQGYLFARPMVADAVMSWKYPTLNVTTPVAEAV